MKFLPLSQLKDFPKNAKGFTLIELLVVIGILGILAGAMVATIDPFEQIKKGTDAKLQNIAVEFYNANLRYYTTHNAMPWHRGCGDYTASTLATESLYPGLSDCIQTLIDEGELKPGFITVTGDLSALTVTEDDNRLTVCYNPQSKSQRAAAGTKYNAGGTPDTSCPADSAACHWCAL